jgi:hypothetical protein
MTERGATHLKACCVVAGHPAERAFDEPAELVGVPVGVHGRAQFVRDDVTARLVGGTGCEVLRCLACFRWAAELARSGPAGSHSGPGAAPALWPVGEPGCALGASPGRSGLPEAWRPGRRARCRRMATTATAAGMAAMPDGDRGHDRDVQRDARGVADRVPVGCHDGQGDKCDHGPGPDSGVPAAAIAALAMESAAFHDDQPFSSCADCGLFPPCSLGPKAAPRRVGVKPLFELAISPGGFGEGAFGFEPRLSAGSLHFALMNARECHDPASISTPGRASAITCRAAESLHFLRQHADHRSSWLIQRQGGHPPGRQGVGQRWRQAV